MTPPSGGDEDWRSVVARADAPGGDRAAVKAVLAELAAVAPGRSVELRVPPVAATQIVEGPAHRRGTPKATVEMDPTTLLGLATGELAWSDAVAAGRVVASGERTDLAHLFPLGAPPESLR